MAVRRPQPYSNSFFNVDLGDGRNLGFHEVQLPQLSEVVVEYRDGDYNVGSSRKLPAARTQVGTLLLKRGFNGDLALYAWWREIEQGKAARRNLSITLLDEMQQPVAQWLLRNAWPSRYYFSPLQGEGRDVLYEIMEVTCESVELQ